jgi:glyoxylase-like metal-dependent hydrolase (beta-lactamase superfamily II)
LADGAVVAVGSTRLLAMSCPGHTPASTVFLDDSRGDLYTGDHVLERIAPTPGIHFDDDCRRVRSLPQYLRSLERLRAFTPRRILPGHGEPFTDLRGAIDRTVNVFNQRGRRLLHRMGDAPATGWDLALRLYPHLRPGATWLVMAEIIGLLDLLEERGHITSVPGETAAFVRTNP